MSGKLCWDLQGAGLIAGPERDGLALAGVEGSDIHLAEQSRQRLASIWSFTR